MLPLLCSPLCLFGVLPEVFSYIFLFCVCSRWFLSFVFSSPHSFAGARFVGVCAQAVNQAWAGHPGTLLRQFSPPVPPPPPPAPNAKQYIAGLTCVDGNAAQIGWSFEGGRLQHGGMCADFGSTYQLTLAACTGAATQRFAFNASTGVLSATGQGCLDVWGWSGPRVDIDKCNQGCNQKFTLSPSGTLGTQCTGTHVAMRVLVSAPAQLFFRATCAAHALSKPAPCVCYAPRSPYFSTYSLLSLSLCVYVCARMRLIQATSRIMRLTNGARILVVAWPKLPPIPVPMAAAAVGAMTSGLFRSGPNPCPREPWRFSQSTRRPRSKCESRSTSPSRSSTSPLHLRPYAMCGRIKTSPVPAPSSQ